MISHPVKDTSPNTNGLELRQNYWDDRESRAAFKRFILAIHNLNFTAWEEAGYWDDRYRPFSWFKDGEVISSVCIYLLDAVVQGRPCKMVQISGVGTHPDFRRRGLNRELADIGLEWAKTQRFRGLFLFADEEAFPFYEHCGFSPLTEYKAVMEIEPLAHRKGLIPLDPANPAHRYRIWTYARYRHPVSDTFWAGTARLFMFHALYTLKNFLYEIPDLECLLAYRRKGDLLEIFDVVGKRIPDLKSLYPFIGCQTDRQVRFHFFPDLLKVDARLETIPESDAFTRGDFPVQPVVFPFTSKA